MDRRFVSGLLLSVLFVFFWIKVISPWLFPRPPQLAPVEAAPASRKSETRPETETRPAPASRPAPNPALVQAVVLENKNLRLTFSTAGATLVKAELLDYAQSPYGPERLDLLMHYADPSDSSSLRVPKALELRDPNDAYAGLDVYAWRIEAADKTSVTFLMEQGVDRFAGPYRIRKTIRLPEAGRHAEVTLALEYLGTGSLEKSLRLTVSGGVSTDSDYYKTHDLTGAQSLIFKDDPQDGEKLIAKTPAEMMKAEVKPGEEPHEQMALNGTRRFVADINSYFGVYCGLEPSMPPRMKATFVGIIDPAQDRAKARPSRTRVDLDFDMISEKGKPSEQKLFYYFGPNEADIIKADLTGDHASWAPEFSRIYGEALGRFSWIGQAVLFLLRLFEKLTGNWGFAIMLLTFFVRLVLFPINRRSQISMVRHSEAMHRIKPKIDALKEKYKNDPKRIIVEQQALHKAEKIPMVPLGGCLPLFLQIPIFYGLFAALRASIELRQAPFLWAPDLSQPDHLVRFATPYPNPISGIPCCCVPPGMSDTISGIHLLPLLMTGAWFLNQLLMPKPATEDPQMKQQRKMMMFLPVMMGFMMYGYGAGLSLYWLTSSLLGIVESRVIKKGLPNRGQPVVPKPGVNGAETIVALSAGAGPAPRGVVRMSGPAAFAIAGRTFVPEKRGALDRGFRSGMLVLDASGATCPAELWCFAAPASYTGEDVVECHTLGAPKLLDLVVRRFVAGGARPAEPGEFTRRALLNGKIDLTRAEAVSAVIRARDADEHRKARALLEGGLAREVASFMDRVIALLVPIELQLDFSDQDVVVLDEANQARKIRALAAEIESSGFASSAGARRLLPRVVLRGPANAGKSSLFNALAGKDLAITTPVRGTTRDVLCAEWRHGEVCALLVDTAGDDVSETALDILAAGARERTLLEADLVLEVRDVRIGGWPAAAGDAIRVGTMADLAAREAQAEAGHGVAVISNATRAGLDVLADRIAAALADSSSRRAEPFLVTARHAAHLVRARAALERAAAVVETSPPELAASDLRAALRELRAITGLEGGDPVLDRIFRDFCIGK